VKRDKYGYFPDRYVNTDIDRPILIGDIGGTKTHLIILDGSDKIFEKKYFNSDFGSFENLLEDFCQISNRTHFPRVGLALAGPIINKQFIKITNLPWIIRSKRIREMLSCEDLLLINDLEAVGHYVSRTVAQSESMNKIALHRARQQGPNRNFVVIGLGTGFGCAGGIEDLRNSSYAVFPSEAGHAHHLPRSEFGKDLSKYLKKHDKAIERENLCSAIGLSNIYNYYSSSFPNIEEQQHKMEMEKTDDISKLILLHAGSCDYCSHLVKEMVVLFVEMLEDIYLEYLPHGGIYLFGGMVDPLIKYLQEYLPDHLTMDGKLSSLSQFISIYATLNTHAVIDGCINYFR